MAALPMKAAILLLFLAAPRPVAADAFPAAMLEAAARGIEHIYEMDFEAAREAFEGIRRLDPEHPFSYNGAAAATWVRYTYGTQRNDASLERGFEEQAELAVRKSRAWVKTHPRDAYGLLSLGGSYGLRSRHSVMKGRWLRALADGRKAIKYTRLANKRDPELYDAYLGPHSAVGEGAYPRISRVVFLRRETALTCAWTTPSEIVRICATIRRN